MENGYKIGREINSIQNVFGVNENTWFQGYEGGVNVVQLGVRKLTTGLDFSKV